MIESKNISVVVQGVIDKDYTHICLASIRKYLPDAEIVLSTWEGSQVDGLDYDVLILSKDPGSVLCDIVYNVPNNVNRQIESSKNGLKASTRQFALKIRSDMELVGTNFLLAYGKYGIAK